ncbi:amino acid decarboxylase [Bacterioplanes sanyensis]|uniref:Amino acid decarboxylase n=1 Tax=Bacterioplanes sanyensis TaxID=1249553 RepID=A0A222FGB2_9GAMM|nr:amino acid decarboxylase [Bacterioplanes sanyensis]ASP37672.1 amino acid decarboxylase [Bacterioplanes sanyensis]
MQSIERLKPMLQEEPCALSTPCYVYSVSAVERNFKALKQALGTQLIYSFKANSNLELMVRCGHIFTDGIELASQGELGLMATGKAPRYINNPSADKNFLRAAIASKAQIIIDHPAQLEVMKDFVGKRPIAPLILRLNPCVLSDYDPQPSLRANHFGMDWPLLQQAINRCQQLQLEVGGVHLFTGSYQFERHAISTAQAALQCVERIQQLLDGPLNFLNLGGGFDEHWQQNDFDFEQYRHLLAEFPSHVTLAHESGRGIMASAGHFVTKVRYTKTIEDRHYAICDGGMAQNFLLAQTENTFRRYAQPTVVHNTTPAGHTGTWLLAGTSCNKDDLIGQLNDASIGVGDFAIFADCGAYNASYTVSPFLNLPTANTYIVE